MSNVEIYGGRGSAPSRQTGRSLARISDRTSLVVAQVQSRGDVQAAKVDATAALTQRALQGAAFLSQVEQQLAQAVPLAASRLQAITDVGALGLAQIVMDTASDLRRF